MLTQFTPEKGLKKASIRMSKQEENITYSLVGKDIKANFRARSGTTQKTNIKVIDIEKAIRAAFESHLSLHKGATRFRRKISRV